MGIEAVRAAVAFVEQCELPAGVGYRGTEEVPDTTGSAAVVVGGDLLSFAGEIAPARRQALLDSALLAQLAAKAQVGDSSKIYEWYECYFNTLMQLGWAIEERSFTEQAHAGEELSVHRAALAAAAALLGETASYFIVVKSMLDALRSMEPSDPMVTLFDSETCTQNAAKFQIGVVSGGADQVGVALMAFGLQSDTRITRVLFFKERHAAVRFRQCCAHVAINVGVLDAIQPVLRKKLVARSLGYLHSLRI